MYREYDIETYVSDKTDTSMCVSSHKHSAGVREIWFILVHFGQIKHHFT
jgi:hypothetical protein